MRHLILATVVGIVVGSAGTYLLLRSAPTSVSYAECVLKEMKGRQQALLPFAIKFCQVRQSQQPPWMGLTDEGPWTAYADEEVLKRASGPTAPIMFMICAWWILNIVIARAMHGLL